MNLIAAVDKNWAIGLHNKLLVSRAYNTEKDTLATTTIGIKFAFSVTETDS